MWEKIKTPAKAVLWGSIPAALVVIAAVLYFRFARIVQPYTPKPGPLTVAAEPKIVETIRRIPVPGPKEIVYLEKTSLSAKLKLPELKTLSDNVLSVATVPPHTGPTTAIATLSPEGEGKILLRKEPTPFFDLKRDFRIEGRYLFAGESVAELDLTANPLRVGPVDLVGGVGVEMDRESSTLRGRAFVGFSYQF